MSGNHMMTPPPAVTRSRDGWMIGLAISSLLTLIAGVATLGMGYTPMWFLTLTVLAVLAAGMRLFKVRKHATQADMDGIISKDS